MPLRWHLRNVILVLTFSLLAAADCDACTVSQASSTAAQNLQDSQDQAELARIAIDSNDSKERQRAVHGLEDQGLLIRVVRESTNVATRHDAARKLTDSSLAEIARAAADIVTRLIAIQHLEDQAVLEELSHGDQPT